MLIMDKDSHTDVGFSQQVPQLQSFAEEIRKLAKTAEGNTLDLLMILRTLEQLHQEIRENFFLASLPENRQQLYHLLREIEAEGGWPYIPRCSLKLLMEKLKFDSPEEIKNEE